MTIGKTVPDYQYVNYHKYLLRKHASICPFLGRDGDQPTELAVVRNLLQAPAVFPRLTRSGHVKHKH